jgi:formylglycine-generating enzyme required for sulfatase activity
VVTAVGEGKVLIPFRIEDVPLSKHMRYFLGTAHWLDAMTPPLERHLQVLATTVERFLAPTRTGPAPAPTEEPAVKVPEAARPRSVTAGPPANEITNSIGMKLVLIPGGDKTHPVGQKRPNAWGLFDMHGNVFEWCWDGFEEKYYANSRGSDPLGSSGASDRVIRGGSWHYFPLFARSANRDGDSPVDRFSYLGFRLARVQFGQ